MTRPPGTTIVSGGSSGLGAAVVQRFAERGDHVVVVDVSAPSTDLPPGATFVRTDVTDSDQVRAAVRHAHSIAPLRTAVACAGVPHTRRVLSARGTLDMAEFDRVVRVNLGGAASLMTHAAEAMAENTPVAGDRGVIVLVASIAAYDGGSVAYASSKAGVAGMVLPAAQNLADHAIRVVGVAPGVFETPMLEGLPQSLGAFAERSLHPRGAGDPSTFAHLVEAIVANPMLNGEVIRLDGGARLY